MKKSLKLEKTTLNRWATEIISILIVVGCILYITWPSLNPFDPRMFDFHDETQLGRVGTFVANLKAGNIPPRLAPEYSFNLGFPLFNFYAPFPYFVTSGMVLMGLDPIIALKSSFLLAIILAGLGTYILCRQWFDNAAAVLGAIVFTSSTYWATEIVIRGNLAETWFLAILPFALLFLYKQTEKSTGMLLIATSIIISFLLTSHNIFALVSIPLLATYIFLFKKKKSGIIAMFFGLLMASYFIIPSFIEVGYTQARELAKFFRYEDHFLCAWQLWTARDWKFGGSMVGCDSDLMSFKVGKLQLLLGLTGIVMFFFFLIKKVLKQNIFPLIFIATITLVSLFLTLYESRFIWDTFSSIMGLFQFPWRFIAPAMFGLGVMSAFAISCIKNTLVRFAIVIALIVALTVPAKKYFIKPLIDGKAYDSRYNSLDYRQTIIAYNVKEYLAKGADYEYWRLLNPLEERSNRLTFNYREPIESDTPVIFKRNDNFYKEIFIQDKGNFWANIHYFPYWQVAYNGKLLKPSKLDNLARPYYSVPGPGTITITYKQTPVENLGNVITLGSFIIILLVAMKRKLYA